MPTTDGDFGSKCVAISAASETFVEEVRQMLAEDRIPSSDASVTKPFPWARQLLEWKLNIPDSVESGQLPYFFTAWELYNALSVLWLENEISAVAAWRKNALEVWNGLANEERLLVRIHEGDLARL